MSIQAVDPEEAAPMRSSRSRQVETLPHVMVIAGEPSGDALGAQLIAALKDLTKGRIRISGVGGEGMESEGLKSLFSIADTSVMGLREVIPAIPTILKRVRQTADFAMRKRPDVIVLIDSPDFTHRIARRLAKKAPELKVVKYVAPQVWASRPKRAAALAEMVDCVMTLLPFEPPLFEREGLQACFVGHPVVERVAQMHGGKEFRERYRISRKAPLLALLPGSRVNEVKFLMEDFRNTTAMLCERVSGLETVIPVVPHVQPQVEAATRNWPVPYHLVGQREKFAAFDAANAALAASGTVSTELALAGVPMVIAYRIGWLSAELMKGMVHTPFITLINLVRREGVIPEYIQEAVDSRVLADELEILLTDPKASQWQQDQQRLALEEMGLGKDSPSLRAGRAVLDMLESAPSETKRSRGRKSFF